MKINIILYYLLKIILPCDSLYKLPFNTIGNKIYDKNHQEFIAKGVSKSGLEYLYIDIKQYTEVIIDFDIKEMKKWNINIVRIPIRDKLWMDYNYQRIIHYFVDKLWSNSIISILDLHTLGNNYGLDPFMKKDKEMDAYKFWKLISIEFKEKEYVWYEIFNEPHNISPKTWWYGDDEYYGYKEIITMIRETTDRIILLGGLDYAYQWKFLEYNKEIYEEMKLNKNIIITTHPYGYKGLPNENGENTIVVPTEIKYPKDENYIGNCSMGYTIPMVEKGRYGWDESFGYIHNHNIFPVILTEFGLDREDTSIQGGWYSNDLIEYVENKSMGWIAWAWIKDRLDYPSLLQENLEPTGIAMNRESCGIKENNYYPGPGLLIYRKLKYQYKIGKMIKILKKKINFNNVRKIYKKVREKDIKKIVIIIVIMIIIYYLYKFIKSREITMNRIRSLQEIYLK